METSALRIAGLRPDLWQALRHTVKSAIGRPGDTLLLEIDPHTKTRGFQLLTVDHLSIDRNLVLNRSDPYIRSRLPQLFRKHAHSVSTDVIRVSSFLCFGSRIQDAGKLHDRYDGEPSLHSTGQTKFVS